MIGERRRPGLPGELLTRVGIIWIGIGSVQALVVALSGWLGPAAGLGQFGPALASFAALGCILLLVGRLAFRFFDIETAGLACLACAAGAPLLAVARPDLADPLAWQVVALLLALNGLMAREPRGGAATVGAASGLGLALSLSAAAWVPAILAALALRWLANRAERVWLVSALPALVAVAVAVLALRWAAGWPAGASELGWPHLAALSWASVVVAALGLREPHPRAFTIAGMAVAALGAAGILAWWAPPVVWPGPITVAAPLALVQAIALPLLGLAATLRLYGQSREWLRRWWGEYGALLALATVLAAIAPRAAPAACALAAVPLGWQVRAWLRAARNARRSSRRALALASIAVAVAPALPLTVLITAAPSLAEDLAG